MVDHETRVQEVREALEEMRRSGELARWFPPPAPPEPTQADRDVLVSLVRAGLAELRKSGEFAKLMRGEKIR